MNLFSLTDSRGRTYFGTASGIAAVAKKLGGIKSAWRATGEQVLIADLPKTESRAAVRHEPKNLTYFTLFWKGAEIGTQATNPSAVSIKKIEDLANVKACSLIVEALQEPKARLV